MAQRLLWSEMEKLILFIILLGCGFFFGRSSEKKHLRSLQIREMKYKVATSNRCKKYKGPATDKTILVQGSVVISIDFFKKVHSSLISFFGGEITPYESLVERARREAVLRLKESCPDADEIINLRIETSSINKGDSNVGAIEVLAYATAIYHAA